MDSTTTAQDKPVKERPILFSGAMVRAILAGTKTQTRRAWPVQPPAGTRVGWVPGKTSAGRYGKTGDRLWVRETWAVQHRYDHLGPSNIPPGAPTHYAATEERGGLRWRPSIHMCRWASRITLELTDVRVERLQDISEADAKAEGAPSADLASGRECIFPHQGTHRWGFQLLWESINGPGSWAANPWVWVIEFKRWPEASKAV